MADSSDSESEQAESPSDLADSVQWTGPLPELPPPPPLMGGELPPPRPGGIEDAPTDERESVKKAPDLPPLDMGMIPPPPPLSSDATEEEEPKEPDIEIPPPPASDKDLSEAADDLLTSMPEIPPPDSPAFAIPPVLAGEMDLPPLPPPPGEDVLEVTDVEEEVGEYRDLWKRRSDKPLQQVYGHIDRLGSGEVGTLLERYADRFGSELDREIIVLRKQEQQQKLKEMHNVPIVELIDDGGGDEKPPAEPIPELGADQLERLEDELERIEVEIDELEPLFKKAKKKRKKAKVRDYGDSLSTLFERRDALLRVIDGEEDFDSIALEDSEAGTDDDFIEFTAVVDDLLGKLPEEALQSFLQSDQFHLYREVAGEPAQADADSKQDFFKLVNEKLVELPESVIDEFIASVDWALYEEMGSRYND